MPLHLPRRRTLAKLGLFLLAGAVVNVGVAWGIAGRANVMGTEAAGPVIRLNDRGEYSWPRLYRSVARNVPVIEQGPPLIPIEFRAPGYLQRKYAEMPPDGVFDPGFEIRWQIATVRSGWPFYAMIGAMGSYVPDAEPDAPTPPIVTVEPSTTRLTWLRDTWKRRFGHRPIFLRASLPLLPLPLGFAANSVLYGAAMYAPFGLLALIIRARRRARGLCPSCKYALANLPTCPECGETIRRKAATQ